MTTRSPSMNFAGPPERQDLGRRVFEKTLSEVPADRRKKKDDDALRTDTNI